jgi:probable blue pigment (indigoidine) exporter
MKTILTGLSFSILWASASIAGKFGLRSVEPLVLFNIRFLLAGFILLMISNVVRKERGPRGKEWKQVTIFGLFNTTLYLGIFIVSLQFITAGITALAVALNPVLISIMSSMVMKRKTVTDEWISIALGMGGVGLAAYPLISDAQVSIIGLGLLVLCMVAYSYGAVYYSSVKWELSRMTINGWQVFIGGLMLLPFTFLTFENKNNFDLTFWASLLWLVIPVSILSVQLWLRLVKADAVKASLWLFLCPVSGIAFSTYLLDEPFSLFTLAGGAMVLCALYIGQRNVWDARNIKS